jgi:site-specific recombinase XerD
MENVLKYNIENNKMANAFMFPALRKRKATKESARMVRIGRIQGDHSISRTQCYNAFREACKLAEIPENLRKDHVLRHTRATLLLAEGVPEEQVQHLLGHEDISTTRGYLGMANALRAKFQTSLSSDIGKKLMGE